ncbi:MAG TPA: glycosyltransferase family 4 protein [Gemmatimonadaceae bacterium]|nr:glycosyltransferase family 4 protein [Gemmatimonadaceae bacterium]
MITFPSLTSWQRGVLAPPTPTPPATQDTLRVLMITSEWPSPGAPRTTFIKRQADFLKAAGVHVDVFAFRGDQNPYKYATMWWRAQSLLVPDRYDLVHAQFGQSGLLALPKRLPLVVTFRGSDLLGVVRDRDGRYSLRGRALQRASRLVARRADAVIVVADFMRQHFATEAPVHVIPSGLDLRLFRPMPRDAARAQLGFAPDERLVLFLGRPTQARKRHGLAKAAVDAMSPRLPARLVVAWRVPHEEIPVYMNACDALLVTSMQEGSTNVVKEALACNLPVVAVPVGDVPERLAGVAGCAVCYDERPETIAAHLEEVLRRGARVDGRSAVRHLDETLLTERVIEIYRSVLNPR